jgi:hypothetical protein
VIGGGGELGRGEVWGAAMRKVIEEVEDECDN